LHFDNRRVRQLEAGSANAAARGFAKLLLQSLSSLAEKISRDSAFPDIAVFQGLSWLSGHGARAGFVTTPIPEGVRKRLLEFYFGLLIHAFAPAPETRTSACPDPHFFWLTRTELLRRYCGGGTATGQHEVNRCSFAAPSNLKVSI
jgi:hypothetical protein